MPPRTPRTPKTRARKDWAPAFLDALTRTGMVTAACDAIGVGRTTAYDRRDVDAEFERAWDEIVERSTEQLEAEAIRRATDGSDVLLMFLLKARRPTVYREHHKVQHVGQDGGPVAVEFTLNEKTREAIASALRGRPASSSQ